MNTQPTGQAENAAPETDAGNQPVNLPPLTDTSIQALDAHFTGGKRIEVAGLEQQEPPKEEPPKEEPPKEEPPKEEPPQEAKPLPGRISTAQFSPEEQEAISMLPALKASDPNASIRDAYAILDRRKAEAPAPLEPSPDPVTTMEEELATVSREIEEAAANDTVLTPDLAKKVTRQAHLAAELAVASDRRASAQATVIETMKSNRQSSHAEALELCPALKDEQSSMTRRVAEVIADLKKTGNPDAHVLTAVNSPMLVMQEAAKREAKEIAQRENISFGTALAKVMGGEPPPPAPQTRKITPASGAASPEPVPPQPSTSELLNSADGFDISKLNAEFDRKFGKPRGMVIGLSSR